MNVENIFYDTIKNHKLCNKKEKILVALSGGKDSAVTAFLLNKGGYNIEGLYVDLGIENYSGNCLNACKKLCKMLNIKLHIYNLKKESGKNMRDIWKKTMKKKLNNCVACGITKKWILNKKARELKVDKIATGHNFDDEVQTFIMNIFKGSPELSLNSGPITKNIKDKKFIQRIKPLFYISENEILKLANKKKLPFIKGKCSYSTNSYRLKIKSFVDELSDKQKNNVINNSEFLLKKVEKKEKKMNYCEICGEPSKKIICSKCKIISY